ncbi:MAG: UDP-N-acetylmuramate--L-alanine ligase [Lachnospiraceae bacterium]|nr:UDP-N-acetylmuramate--L-alanine ligase [Lachnospiraceae bacterium]
MYLIDYEHPVRVHFIGIGGISMSGLAEILLDRGFEVSGSDRAPSEITGILEEKGIKVFYGQKASNISDDIKLVVYTAAIHEDNEEFAEAKRRGIPILKRAELLGQIMGNYEVSVAVAGTHGKTTTTSMVTDILMAADLDPTVSVGGMLREIGGNIRIGRSGYFVTEACEYTNSFLSFKPTANIILNIEEDHLDFFKDIEDIRSSFRRFAGLLPKEGILVINSDIDRYKEITDGLECNVLTVSPSEGADAGYTATDVSFDGSGCASFTVIRSAEAAGICGLEEGAAGRYELKVPGGHNIGNALAAIALAEFLGIDSDKIASGFLAFRGTDRRFQIKGKLGEATVIDDYAHHPTEIRATLSTAANYPHERIICVFQPHTYSRTKAFFDEFVDALKGADIIVLAPIYAARETDTLGISSDMISEALKKIGKESYSFSTFSEIEEFLRKKSCKGDLLITMGAGDIVKVGEDLIGT